MNVQRRAFLLIGSAKRPAGTSESLGNYLLKKLSLRGFATETRLVHSALLTDQGVSTLLEATDRAELFVIVFPLYVDSLPAQLVRALELIAKHRARHNHSRTQRLVAIANCGLPEPQHNDSALAICRRFALETGFVWAGGLSLGGGAAIDGRPLAQVAGMARNVISALDLAAGNLSVGGVVSQEAIDAMKKPMVPRWGYTFLGGMGWNMQAKRNGVRRDISARPYSENKE